MYAAGSSARLATGGSSGLVTMRTRADTFAYITGLGTGRHFAIDAFGETDLRGTFTVTAARRR